MPDCQIFVLLCEIAVLSLATSTGVTTVNTEHSEEASGGGKR